MLLFENIKLALASIRSNKMRSFLTMLGIIIGISSVIAITCIGDSAKATVGKEFENFGKNAVYIYINWQMTGDYIEDNDLISEEDLEALKERFPQDIAYIAPWSSTSSEVVMGNRKGKFEAGGVDANYLKYKKMKMLHGRMIIQSDVDGARDRIVIEKSAAEYFFNKTDVIGKTLPFTIMGEPKDLTIVGVYEVEESIFSKLGGNSGAYAAFVPYTLIPGSDLTYSVDAYIAEGKDVEASVTKLVRYLEKIKDKPFDYYKFETAVGQQGMVDQILGTLSLAIGAIAAISLAVGGIGIMNIMLVSVTERTREIGIRKSLGARTQDVLQQFLIEAMILSAIGGLVGTLLGLGIAAIGMKVAGVALIINPFVVVVAVVFSALVGMFFGLYPAKKAAKLDPIEALRYE